MQSSSKGFTLIELLVVIAIIGILSSVVLASLNSARTKGADAAIKANLSGLRAQAEIYYDGHTSSYALPAAATDCITGMLAIANDATIAAAVQKAKDNSGNSAGCLAKTSETSYAVAVPLKSNPAKLWCVDNSSTAKEVTAGAGAIAGTGASTDPFKCGT